MGTVSPCLASGRLLVSTFFPCRTGFGILFFVFVSIAPRVASAGFDFLSLTTSLRAVFFFSASVCGQVVEFVEFEVWLLTYPGFLVAVRTSVTTECGRIYPIYSGGFDV